MDVENISKYFKKRYLKHFIPFLSFPNLALSNPHHPFCSFNTNMSSTQKVHILITGANQGLGFVSAQQLLRQGDHLHIYLGVRDQKKGEEALEKLNEQKDKKASNSVELILLDITNDSSIEQVVKTIKQLDILVNSAGISGGFDDTSSPSTIRNQLRTVYDTNVFGTAALTHTLLPLLTNGQHSVKPAIINISSDLGSFGNQSNPNWRHYNIPLAFYPSTKSALNMLTRVYSKQYPNLRIISVNPGYTATNFNGNTGYKTPEEGASAYTHAILNFNGPTGVFVEQEGELIPW